MNRKYIIGLICIVLTTIFWGLSFPSIKVSLSTLTPMNLAASRFAIATIFLTVIYIVCVKEKRFDKKDLGMFALSGLLGTTLYFYFENTAIKYISSSSASLIVGAVPVISLVADVLIFKTKLQRKHMFSVVLSFIGVYYIVKNAPTDGNTTKGFIMMGISVLIWVAYTVSSKPLQKKYDTITVTYFQTLIGTIFLLPFLFIEPISMSDLNSVVTFNVVYLGIVCSALGYFLYLEALDKLGLTVTSMFLNLIPVVTVISSYFLLGEKLTMYQMFGGVLVIIAVCSISYKVNDSLDEECIEDKEIQVG